MQECYYYARTPMRIISQRCALRKSGSQQQILKMIRNCAPDDTSEGSHSNNGSVY